MTQAHTSPVAYTSRLGTVRTAGLVLSTVLPAALASNTGDWRLFAGLALFAAGAAGVLALIVMRWLRGQPELVLDADGLKVHGLLGRRHVSWRDVAWLEYEAPDDGPERLIVHVQSGRTSNIVALTPAHLGTTVDELQRCIRRFLPNVRVVSEPGEGLVARVNARQALQDEKDAAAAERMHRLVDDAVRRHRGGA